MFCKGVHNVQQLADAKISMGLKALVLRNSTMAFDKLIENNFTVLRNLYKLRLQDGVSLDVLKSLIHFGVLRWLAVMDYGIKDLAYVPCPYLLTLDVSDNAIHLIHKQALRQLQYLKVLILTSNKISVVKQHFFEHLKSLRILHLFDNPISEIDTGIFVENSKLVHIRSDCYMVCCTAMLVEDCKPQGSYVSSCSSLFSGIPKKIIIAVQGTTATVTNSTALIFTSVCFISLTVPIGP